MQLKVNETRFSLTTGSQLTTVNQVFVHCNVTFYEEYFCHSFYGTWIRSRYECPIVLVAYVTQINHRQENKNFTVFWGFGP